MKHYSDIIKKVVHENENKCVSESFKSAFESKKNEQMYTLSYSAAFDLFSNIKISLKLSKPSYIQGESVERVEFTHYLNFPFWILYKSLCFIIFLLKIIYQSTFGNI